MPPHAVSDVYDLAANAAGAAAWAKRNEINAQAPVLNLVARLLAVQTEERNWRIGAKGEEMVGRESAKLGDAWRVLHAVPLGNRGRDIDHLLIGPPGVFTVNTKRRPLAKVWVGERTVRVNGHRTDYLPKSRDERDRSATLLTKACGFDVPVRSALVFVGLSDFTVKTPPDDVIVTTCRQLVKRLRSEPTMLTPDHIEYLYAHARRSVTWD